MRLGQIRVKGNGRLPVGFEGLWVGTFACVCVCVLVSKGSLLMVARSDTAELEAFEWGGVLML